MTLQDLADLVRDMRAAQRRYFRNREPADLQASRKLESRVDVVLDYLARREPDLFTATPLEKELHHEQAPQSDSGTAQGPGGPLR